MTVNDVVYGLAALVLCALLVLAGFICGYLHVVVNSEVWPLTKGCVVMEIDGREFHYCVDQHAMTTTPIH